MTDSSTRRGVLHSSWAPFLWALLFLAIFVAVFYLQKPTTLPVNNGTIKEIFATYGAASGAIVALLGILVMYILALVKRLVGLRKFPILNPVVIFAVAFSGFVFGWELLYVEPTYTDIARAIIGYLGRPLFYASGIISALALVWFLIILLRPLLRRH
ncbi:MAG: hypothetical protein WCS85_03155 [Candidatus Peribacteraceae bacterium]